MTARGMIADASLPAASRRTLPRLAIGARPHGLAPDELVKLHHTLIDALPSGRGIVAQLVAPEPDAAITEVAYDLAYVSASWLDKRVLYVNGTGMRLERDDLTPRRRDDLDPRRRDNLDPRRRDEADFSERFDPADLEASISRVVGLELYQMTFPSMRGALDLAPVLRRIPQFMERLRETFDLVVIASPPASEAPMGVLLSRYVDGNVLVLEAGRIRAPAAAALRDSLRSSGGTVVGVVLDKVPVVRAALDQSLAMTRGKPPMHVMMVNNIYPPIMAGGAELMVAVLCEGLARRGHRVTAVSTCGPEMEPYPVEIRNDVTVIRFFPKNVYWNFAREGQPPARRALWHLRDAWNRDAGRKFRAILDTSPPDLVHTHLIDGFSASIWGRARRAGVPIAHTAHDYHLLCPRAFLLDRDWRLCLRPSFGCRAYRAWHLRTAIDVDLFVGPSRFLLDRHREAGYRPRREAVVRNGIPLPPDIDAIRAARRSGGSRFLLMCRLTPEKGVRVALRAVAALPDDLDFELVIAGRGPLEAEARQVANNDPRIRYAGYVGGADKVALLASADHVLVPSLWYENAPLAVIEAAAYGLGVIGSRIGGIPELVREGSTGLLCAPGDHHALANAMRGLASGGIVLDDLAGQSRDLARSFTVERMVDGYQAEYVRLVEARALESRRVAA